MINYVYYYNRGNKTFDYRLEMQMIREGRREDDITLLDDSNDEGECL